MRNSIEILEWEQFKGQYLIWNMIRRILLPRFPQISAITQGKNNERIPIYWKSA